MARFPMGKFSERTQPPSSYNANTDSSVQQNKTDAVAHICADFLSNFPNENTTAYSVRYQGGYYASYILTRAYYSADPVILVEELGMQTLVGKFSFYTYDINNATVTFRWALT